MDVPGHLLRKSAALVVARNTLYDVYKVVNAIEFRHDSVPCNCPICQDIRNVISPLKVLTGKVLEKLDEIAKQDAAEFEAGK